jgi:hypothetical protein
MRAASAKGDRRVGVVWHTQGSGKSFSMLFYAGAIARSAAMENPTVVVLTDRNDLDQQLYGQFLRCQDTLGQKPEQADSRARLRDLLRVASGGVVFTTIQKFMPDEKGDRMPCLSERRNIVVIADEAHRSQYDLIDGLARHLRDAVPNASFIGFTGTPIEKTDANTRAVFGDYVSVYDIQQAVADGATVPIYYESRIAKLGLLEAELPRPPLWASLREASWGLAAPVLILGGMRAGWFTPTEAAVVAVFYGLFVGMAVHRTIRLRDLYPILRDAGELSAVVLIVVSLAGIFAYSLSTLGVIDPITKAIVSSGLGEAGVLALLVLLLVVVGMFLDGVSIFLIFIPLLLPIATFYKWDLVWFGVLLTLMVAIGQFTPPMAVNLMVSCRIAGVRMEETVRWIGWLLAATLVVALAVIVWPELALWLPRKLGY